MKKVTAQRREGNKWGEKDLSQEYEIHCTYLNSYIGKSYTDRGRKGKDATEDCLLLISIAEPRKQRGERYAKRKHVIG